MIAGEKIQLIALEPGDIDLLYRWENDPLVWAVSGTSGPFSKYTLQEYIKTANQDIFTTKQLRLVICLNESDEKIGFIDLFEYDPLNNRAGVGILIGDRTQRNKGFATEALNLLKRYAFRTIGIHQLYCHVQVSNNESIKLFERCGFSRVATLRDWIKDAGRYEDVILFQLIDEEI